MVVFKNDLLELRHGHVLEELADMEEGSVNCAVTSPPYWGLRDYGLEPVVWGGRADCAHAWGEWSENHDERESTKHGKSRTTGRFYGESSRRFDGNHQKHTAGQFCQDCQAWRGCLGLEPTPELYVAHLVEVFRAVRRVLRDDGTLWLNLGDSYAAAGGHTSQGKSSMITSSEQQAVRNRGTTRIPDGFKPKDLIGIPWRVAFAFQVDGWWLRSDIIWSKPNPMPESVTDRPTRAHEYLFLLTKSARYYYDHEAVEEVAVAKTNRKGAKKLQRTVLTPGAKNDEFRERWQPRGRRNRRSVWSVATTPFPGAHFATFPKRLVEPCILAGCPRGGVVLDPFLGSGTVSLVAAGHDRRSVGVDAKFEYLAMAVKRLFEYL